MPKILNQQLPAVNAHIKMAPLERQQTLQMEDYSKYKPRKSAVMMLFYPKDNHAHLMLIKRNTYPGIHSAQISFPGGKAEVFDKDLAATALRETHEEIGILPQDIDVVMPFTEIYIPPSNFMVFPFLGFCLTQPVFNPNPAEVAQLIELPLDVFLDDSIIINTCMKTSYQAEVLVPAFKVEEHIVWGATAMMLSELKETIKIALE
ncbi:NUDIX hydrolase [Flavobacterium subsaxonicum WB 4.1-42 = DSM 21790]|uniref:NUDIX hydrolase n=1 Tax=Flavobacterium subsaxonicum WB 4.1-42 = DSM 21790 TaxID=1121898 RepID=A0A0A2MLJ1_9FLAO|nr:NUDIX hydrolase [Flavobacterium subsaxonicum WB 4.1-42 = DSM 21790]